MTNSKDFEDLARAIGETANKVFREAGKAGRAGGGPRGPRGGRGQQPGFGPGGPRGRGMRGSFKVADVPNADDAASWFAGRLPDGLYAGPVEVTVDRDEIVVVGPVEAPETAADATDADIAAAESGRISRFREETRDERIAVAQEAEHRYQRKVAWGAQAGGSRELFSIANVPVMTRLLQSERMVLDTLVDGGVARSRSEALAWCVRLVGENAGSWLGDLREAMAHVDEIRKSGPAVGVPTEDAQDDD